MIRGAVKEDHNLLVLFFRKIKDHKLIIVRKRLPNRTPKWTRDYQLAIMLNTGVGACKFMMKRLGLSLKDSHALYKSLWTTTTLDEFINNVRDLNNGEEL